MKIPPIDQDQPTHIALTLAVCGVLVALIWAVFGQTIHHQFVNYDDPLYVLENAHVRSGLSWRNAIWAFTHVHSQNWHPLTSLSHMLDCQVFDLKPGAHHFVNVSLHTLAALLLFLVLRQMTANFWPSAFVAVIFAIHPLRVESVAWIAERKDVLSGVFFMLTLMSYVHHVRRPSFGRYVVTSILFACGLMSKPMLVTTPIVLLLLDYWPLRRVTSKSSNTKLLLEKIPFFTLSILSVVATLLAQNLAIGSTEMLPLKWRITNSIVSYFDYIRQMFWPRDLIPFYLHPEGRLEMWRLILATTVLLFLFVVAVVRRKKNPYLIVGWLWYIVMLLPVIGFIQVGLQGRADRYTYLPQIGLYIAIVWAVRDLTASWRSRVFVLAPAGAIVVGALSILAWKQTAHWQDTETLWTYTLKVTPDSDVAHTGLAGILAVRGRPDEAVSHYRRAIELRSGNSGAQYGLAKTLAEQHKVDEAIVHWKKALELQPDNLDAGNSLALMFIHRGEYAEAVKQWRQTLQFDPENVDALNNLAWLLATTTDESVRDAKSALELAERVNRLTNFSNPTFLRTLSVAQGENGRFSEAAATAEKGAHVAEERGNNSLAENLRHLVGLFRQNKSPRDERAAP